MNKKLVKTLAALTSVSAMTAMCTVTAFAEEAAAAPEQPSTASMLISTLALPMILLFALYFIMIRPQRKAEKETREMQNSLQIGDEVITIGGIVGIVLRVEENTKTVVLETGSDRLKIRMMQDAIKENVTAREAKEAEKAEKLKARTQPKITKE
jgi:preprotein translocase subunit YajC